MQMTKPEFDFWFTLEHRISEILDRATDGILPSRFIFGEDIAEIEGRIDFFEHGPGNPIEGHRFRLVLPPGPASYEAVDWASLMPLLTHDGWVHWDDDELTADLST